MFIFLVIIKVVKINDFSGSHFQIVFLLLVLVPLFSSDFRQWRLSVGVQQLGLGSHRTSPRHPLLHLGDQLLQRALQDSLLDNRVF